MTVTARARTRIAALAALSFVAPLVGLSVTASQDAALGAASPATTTTAPGQICPGGRRVGGVVHCADLFAHGRPIRLPADPSPTTRYGAFTRGGTSFFTRAGRFPLAPSVRDAFLRSDAPRTAYARRVYLAGINGGRVTSLRVAVTIPERAIMRTFFAHTVMEGRIGRRTSDGRYTETRMLPVRVAFSGVNQHGRVLGRIVNAQHSVLSSRHECLPALSAQRGDPLKGGFGAAVRLRRIPSMHAPFDDELVLLWNASASDMGQGFFPSAATVLGGDPLTARWTARIHGVPTAGPTVKLRFVKGGGAACVAATSATAPAAVPVAGRLTTSTPTPHAGQRIRLTATVPGTVRRTVVLQRATRSGWQRVASRLSTRHGVARFAVRAPSRAGRYTYRAIAGRMATETVVHRAVRTRVVHIRVAPALGSRSHPYPIDTPFRRGDWVFALGATDTDNTPEEVANGYDTAPEPGWSYISVPVTVTYRGSGTGTPVDDTDVTFVGSDGVRYGPSTQDGQVCMAPNDYYEVAAMRPGATATANQCVVIRTAAIAGGLWRVDSTGNHEGPHAFVKQH